MRSIVSLAIAAVGVILALGLETARAAPAFTTNYTFYSVSGTSTTGVLASLLRNSLKVNGARHHALTVIQFSTPRTVRSAKGCRLSGLSVRFQIRLPRHSNEASLSANDRRLWQQFAGFVRKHEETHRAIWMECARRIDAVLTGMQGRNCGEVAQRARNIIEQVKPVCRRKDIAFDAAEKGRLDNHPFMNAAVAPIYTPLKTKRKTSALLAD